MSRGLLLALVLLLTGCGDGGGGAGLTLIAAGLVLAALIGFASDHWNGGE